MTESTLAKFDDDTKLGGEIHLSAVLQKDFDRLKDWTSKNNINKDVQSPAPGSFPSTG